MKPTTPDDPIVHVVQHLRPGGLEVMALELARAQAAHHATMIISLEGAEEQAIAAWPRLAGQHERLIFLGKRPGLDPTLFVRLYLVFRRLKPACVHTHHIGPLLYAGAAARAAGVKRRVHTEHDAWHLTDARRRRVARLAIAAARPVLVADAPHVADAVVEALGCVRPKVVLNGVDTARFVPGNRAAARRALGLPQDMPIVGVAARLEPVKGVDVAIGALARMDRRAILAIAGTGSQQETLRQLAAALNVADRVLFLGHVDEMSRFYAALDVLCLSSRAEGLPLSLLEAQATGVPVVASAVGGVPAATCPRSGRLVPSEDVAGFAAALDAVLDTAPDGEPREFVVRTASLTASSDAYLELCLGTAQA
jgi:glycosyltransferase involved in cell wall biosynthesis